MFNCPFCEIELNVQHRSNYSNVLSYTYHYQQYLIVLYWYKALPLTNIYVIYVQMTSIEWY